MFHSLIKQTATLETLQLATLGVWLAHCTITGLVPLAQQTCDQQCYLKCWPNIYMDKVVEGKLHINWFNPSTKCPIIMFKKNNTHWGNFCMSLWYITSNGGTQHFLQDYQTHQNLRAETWPADSNTPVREWPCGEQPMYIQLTATNVQATRVPVRVNNNAKEENMNMQAIYTPPLSLFQCTIQHKEWKFWFKYQHLCWAQLKGPLANVGLVIFNILSTQV